MFYAIDKITGEIILSINIRSENYKNTYNKSLRFLCGGCIENGDKCNDNNVSFVNSKSKQSHFRHSKNTECSASKAFKEFNIDFYKNWFDLFKKEYRKPYWFNVKLEEIRNDDNIIMIRYSHQTEKRIKNIESYVKEDNKIIWILSLENRKYHKIFFHKGKFYIDFIGNKNDIPLYDNNKSIIYLDTGYDVLLKIKLDSYNNKGQEIELIYIKDFCNEYDELFIAYPYRTTFNYIKSILNEKNIYDNIIINLLEEYKKIEEELKISKYIAENLRDLYYIYNKLNDLNYNIIFNYQEEYDICVNKIQIVSMDINKYIKENNFNKFFVLFNDSNLTYYFKNNNIDNNFLEKINNIKKLYNILFDYKKIIEQKYNTFIENRNWFIFEEKYKEYNIILELEKILNEYHITNEYISEYNYILNILNDYDNICYNYLNVSFKRQKEEKNKLFELLKKELQIIKKNKEKQRKSKQKIRKIKEKEDNDNEKKIIEQKYNYYIKEYNITDEELLNVLLEIIKNNNNKIKDVKDEYLHKYYIYITHHLNYDIFKMIKYIIYQDMYL